MCDYLDRVRKVQITRERKSIPSLSADNRELAEYRSLAGVLLYLGQAVMPQASLVASKMQQKLGALTVAHLLYANVMVTDLKKLGPALLYPLPTEI